VVVKSSVFLRASIASRKGQVDKKKVRRSDTFCANAGKHPAASTPTSAGKGGRGLAIVARGFISRRTHGGGNAAVSKVDMNPVEGLHYLKARFLSSRSKKKKNKSRAERGRAGRSKGLMHNRLWKNHFT